MMAKLTGELREKVLIRINETKQLHPNWANTRVFQEAMEHVFGTNPNTWPIANTSGNVSRYMGFAMKLLGTNPVFSSPIDEIAALEKQIQSKVQELETERQRHHDTIVKIDNLIAAIKHRGSLL